MFYMYVLTVVITIKSCKKKVKYVISLWTDYLQIDDIDMALQKST